MSYTTEVFYNVWNCQATLRVELWETYGGGAKLIEGAEIESTEAEIEANVTMINMSGRYPVDMDTLTPETRQKIEKQLLTYNEKIETL